MPGGGAGASRPWLPDGGEIVLELFPEVEDFRAVAGDTTLGRLAGGEIIRGELVWPATAVGGGGGAPGGGGEIVEMVLSDPKFSLLTTDTIDKPLARASDAVSGRTELFGSVVGGIVMSFGGVVNASALKEGIGGRS